MHSFVAGNLSDVNAGIARRPVLAGVRQVVMSSLMRRFADSTGFYRWLRCSRYYEPWSRIRRTSFAKEAATDRVFFQTLFGQSSIDRVFDVGANIGDKSSLFEELGAAVVCIEADPAMAELLEYRFSKQQRVIVAGVAVGAEAGTAKMFRKSFSGFNTLSEKWSETVSQLGVGPKDAIDVPVTTLDCLIAMHGVPDYLKIDVEGYELPTIRGLSHAVRVVSFEVNVPAFLVETRLIVERL